MGSFDTDDRFTVLIAEDDPMVRAIASKSLQRAGYHVLEAGTGHDAAQVACLYSECIHLLVADAILPGMSGAAVVQTVLRIRPDTRVLFITASPDTAPVPTWAVEQGLLLPKPFYVETFLQKVAAVLGGGPPRLPEA